MDSDSVGSNTYAMTRNRDNQNPNPVHKTKTGIQITKIAISQNKKITCGQPSEHIFPKRWPPSNPNRSKIILNIADSEKNAHTPGGSRQTSGNI